MVMDDQKGEEKRMKEQAQPEEEKKIVSISNLQIRAMKKMQDRGFTLESIAKAQGLSLDEVEYIFNQISGKDWRKITRIDYQIIPKKEQA